MKKSKKREKTVEIATKLFCANGYHATSMRQLAKASGVGVAALYTHVESKQELLADICFNIGEKFISLLKELENENLETEDNLRKFIKNHLTLMEQNTESVLVYNREWKFLEEPKLSEFSKLMKQYESGLSKFLANGVEEGVFIPLDPYTTSHYILSSLNSLKNLKKHNRSEKMNLYQQVSNIIVVGLLKANHK